MNPYSKFGNLLNHYLAEQERSVFWLAERLEIKPSVVSRWLDGELRPDNSELIDSIADILRIYDQSERQKMLIAAGYATNEPDSTAESVGSATTVTNIDNRGGFYSAGDVKIGGDVITNGTKNVFLFGSQFFIDALKSWNESVFGWSEADEHMLSSWEGRVLHGMSAITDRISPRGLLTFLLTLALWMLTWWLIGPMLAWPLGDESYRQIVFIKYGVATLLVPLLVTLVTPAEKQELFELNTLKQRVTLWRVKFTGALVGFWLFSVIIIIITLIAYYFNLLFVTPIRVFLTFVPLFFSYITARRIPVDRYKMFEGEFRPHEADFFFLGTFLFVAPSTSIFLYYNYWFFTDKTVTPIIALSALIAITLWEYRKRNQHSISDPIMILILGGFFPLLLPILVYLLTEGLPALSQNELPALFMILMYFFSWTLLGATLLVRNNLTWTFSSLFATLAVFLLLLLPLSANLLLARALVITIVLAWTLWGRKRFREYLFAHESYWVLQFAIGGSLYLWARTTVPLWVNALGFLLLFVLLMTWAYQSPQARTTNTTPAPTPPPNSPI